MKDRGHYFNEFDPRAADWLRELIRAGHLPAGEVDERDIHDVAPADLAGFRACHFFAGIAGWPLALALAGWPDDREVWTGSCPCQPYSSAGRGKGDADPRNLWPEFFRLIRECRPECVFGEQVEGAIRHGWLDRVSADLEAEGYAVGAAVLGAHSAGAPHIRQRLFWVADAGSNRRHDQQGIPRIEGGSRERGNQSLDGGPNDRRVGDAVVGRVRRHAGDAPGPEEGGTGGGEVDGSGGVESVRTGPPRGVGNAGPQGLPAPERLDLLGAGRREEGGTTPEPGGPPRGFWDAFDLLPCRDGKARRVEPGTFPLAHGLSGRVVLLRGYGNAIVPQVAAEFVRAFLEEEAPPPEGAVA